MTVLAAPVLPARKEHKYPKMVRIGAALAWSILAAAIVAIMIHSFLIPGAAMPAKLLYGMTSFSFVIIFGFTYFVDYSKPTVTLEEMWYRKRLDMALARDARVAQLDADRALLQTAADDLWQTLGKDGFATLKDADIVEHAIELARKKTVD